MVNFKNMNMNKYTFHASKDTNYFIKTKWNFIFKLKLVTYNLNIFQYRFEG